MLKKHFKVIATILLIVSLIITPICVSAEYEAILYIREDMAYYTITDGITIGSTYTHNALPEYTPDGKYFVGWFDENGNATNKVTIKAETNLYARYKDYLTDGVAADYTRLETKPELKGVTYVKNGVYGTSVTETGWALSSWSSDLGGALLGKPFTGGAYGWEPVEQTDKTQVAAKHNGYVIATQNHPVGSINEIGWTAYSNFILRDNDGYALVPKENTKYAVTVTYELLEEGNLTLFLTADRKLAQIDKGANATAVSAYSTNYVKAGLSTKGVKVGEQLTHTYYITTEEFGDSVPMFSIHCQAHSFMAERVATAPGSDGNNYASYTVGEATYYPYKIVSAPQVVIRQVAVNEVEEGNVVVNYQTYEKGVGFSTTVVDGAPETSVEKINSLSATPDLWYSEKDALKIANTSIFPVADRFYYSVSYLANNGEEFKNGKLYFDATEETVTKDGQSVKAVRNLNKIRVGNVVDGNSYKLSFSLMAQSLTDDIGIEVVSAGSWDAQTLKNTANSRDFLIKKDEITANGVTWYDFEYYFTADTLDVNVDSEETGLDYNKTCNGANAVFMLINSESKKDLYFTDITLTDLGQVISSKGASVLKEEEAENIGRQAMRFYFDYETADGSTVTLDGKPFKVIERGFIYRKGNLEYFQQEEANFNANADGVVKTQTTLLNKCWSYDDQTQRLTFSTFVKNFNKTDSRKLEVKGYIVIEDSYGKQHLIHSATTNRTIKGIKDGKEDNPRERKLVWNEEFDYYSSITQVSNFTQEFDSMTSLDDNLKTTESEDNYFIDSATGELVLRVTSDGNKNYTTPKSVTSQGLMAFKYGYLEARIKVPRGNGTWATFWTQSDKSSLNNFEYKGEIDIIGKGDKEFDMSIALHKWYRNASGVSTNTAIGKHNIGKAGHYLYGQPIYDFESKDNANDYHIYGFDWTSEYMAFYIDYQLVWKVDITNETGEFDKNVPGMECFHGYHYLCLNNWVFTEDKTWAGPQNFVENLPDFAQNGVDYKVDYIRLYQNSDEEIYNY